MLTDLRSSYGVLQSLTIVFLIFSWLARAGKILRVSIIASTIGNAFEPLMEALFVALLMTAMLASVVHLTIGYKVGEWSTLIRSVSLTFQNLIVGEIRN